MTYEEELISFLSKKENLGIAIEVAGLVDKVKRKLITDFWNDCYRVVSSRFSEERLNENWSISYHPENIFSACAKIIAMEPRAVGNKQDLFLSFNVSQESDSTIYVKFTFNKGLRAKLENVITITDIKKLWDSLNGNGYKSSNWSFWLYTSSKSSSKDFLLEYTSEPETLVKTVADTIWHHFDQNQVNANDVNISIYDAIRKGESYP